MVKAALVALLAIFVVGWDSMAVIATAAENSISISVNPDPIELPSSCLRSRCPGSGLVIVQNNGEAPANVRLQVIGDVQTRPLEKRVIAAGSSGAWSLSLTRRESTRQPDKIVVLVRATFGSVKIQKAQTVTLTDVRAFDISKARLTALETTLPVDDTHEAEFLVRIDNPTDEAVTVKDISGSGPSYVSVTLASDSPLPHKIQGHSSGFFRMHAIGRGHMQRGVSQASATALLVWGAKDRNSGTLAVNQPIEVGAFAESGLGQVLSVPILLMAPGAVALALLSVLWGFGIRPGQGDSESPFPTSGLLFGVVVIIISLLAAGVWWAATGHNLLSGYGTREILILVVATSALCVLIYSFVCLGSWLYGRVRRGRAAKEAAATALTVGMEPRALLDALAARSSSLWVAQALQPWGSSQRRVLLPIESPSGARVLVCSPIELVLCEGVGRPLAQHQTMEQDFIAALNGDARAVELTHALDRAGSSFGLRWRETGRGLAGLESVDSKLLTPVGDTTSLVVLA
jgi:hypothetical protein